MVFVSSRRVETCNVTLKGQDQIWPQVKVGQGHEVTQVGLIIYQSTRLYETNALTSVPRLYLLLIASYWQKRLVTSSDLIWPLEVVRDQKFRFKYE